MRRIRALACGGVAAALLAGCSPAPPAPTVTPTVPVASVTPAVPAPTASAAETAPERVVGLGDSIMAGTNCACDGPLAAYADRLASERGVRPEDDNLAVAGWTTHDVLRQVQQDADARAAIEEADVVVLVVGANDLFRMGLRPQDDGGAGALSQGVVTLQDRLATVLAELRAIRGDRPTTYLVAGYWDILSAPGDESTWSAIATGAVNTAIRATAEGADMRYVDLGEAFAEAGGADGVRPFISDDGLHPNADGARVIGEAFAAATP